MEEDPSVKEVLSAAASIPKRLGKSVLDAKVPVSGARKFFARFWLPAALFVGLVVWVVIRHLVFIDESRVNRGMLKSYDEELAQAAEVAKLSIWAAAFSEENSIGSALSRKTPDAGLSNDFDPDFDLIDYIRTNNLWSVSESLYGTFNEAYAEAILAELRRKQLYREALASAGFAGILVALVTRLFDFPGLILLCAVLWARRTEVVS